MYDNIKYLVHSTPINNALEILRYKNIYTHSEYTYLGLQPEDGLTEVNHKLQFNYNDVYPGVFLQPISKYDIGDKITDIVNEVSLVFSTDLLFFRKDYHINTMDINGYILPPFYKGKYGKTFTYNTLKKYMEYAEEYHVKDGEVVFHSRVPTHYMLNIIVRSNKVKNRLVKQLRNMNLEWYIDYIIVTDIYTELTNPILHFGKYYNGLKYTIQFTPLYTYDYSWEDIPKYIEYLESFNIKVKLNISKYFCEEDVLQHLDQLCYKKFKKLNKANFLRFYS